MHAYVCKWPCIDLRMRVQFFSFTVHCTWELPVVGTDESQMRKWKSKRKNSYSRGSAKEDVLCILQALNQMMLHGIKSCLMQHCVKNPSNFAMWKKLHLQMNWLAVILLMKSISPSRFYQCRNCWASLKGEKTLNMRLNAFVQMSTNLWCPQWWAGTHINHWQD